MNTNMVYSTGHVEFHHGELTKKLDPTPEQIDLFQEICQKSQHELQA